MKPSIKITAIVLVAIAAIAAILYLGLSRSKNSVPEVSTGTLERYPDFPSKHIDKRTVSVWLPEGYTQGAPFDVLYMHDGQMLFDAKTTWNHQEWMVDEVLGSIIGAGEMRPCIVVAVDNTNDRLMEYFPDKAANYLEAKPDSFTPKGDAYLRFLVEELKPFIDDTYQPLSSREHTFLMGSSMGGLISLYALCEYPEVFGGKQ